MVMVPRTSHDADDYDRDDYYQYGGDDGNDQV